MVRQITLKTETLDFAALSAGSGEDYALCFHGFPDDASSMEPLLTRLADEGYRAVAPYMRGYGETERPPLDPANYSIPKLGSDVLAVANAVEAENPLVVGHDWGAIAVSTVSALAPDFAQACVAMAVPPDFVRGLHTEPVQAMRSWYMSFFQLPGLAEEALRRDNFALVDRLWRLWSPGWDYSADRIESVKETFRTERTVEASLQYYRSFYEDFLTRASEDLVISGIEVPTLLVAGRNDGCIGANLFDRSQECYDGPHHTEVVNGAGHFVHNERSDLVADLILEFVD